MSVQVIVLEYVFDYYSKRTDITKKPFPKSSALSRASRDIIVITEGDIPELKETIKGQKRIWLVLSHAANANAVLAAEIAKNSQDCDAALLYERS